MIVGNDVGMVVEVCERKSVLCRTIQGEWSSIEEGEPGVRDCDVD